MRKIFYKVKLMLFILPLLILSNPVFAADDITRKVNELKYWAMGIFPTLALVAWGYSKAMLGWSKTPEEESKYTKLANNAFKSLIGLLLIDSFLLLWINW